VHKFNTESTKKKREKKELSLFSPFLYSFYYIWYLENISKMTTNQIKTEIQKVLDTMPEVVLEDILEYLKTVQSKSVDSVNLSQNMRKILIEDRELLKKLAQ